MMKNATLPGVEKTPEQEKQLEAEKKQLILQLQAAANLPSALRHIVQIAECMDANEADLVKSLLKRASLRVRQVSAALGQWLS